jgi:hypothetical protein
LFGESLEVLVNQNKESNKKRPLIMKKPVKYLWITSAALMVLIPAVYFCLIPLYQPFSLSRNNSTDMDIVELWVSSTKSGRTDLCIPKAYIEFKHMKDEGQQKAVNVNLHYPDFRSWNVYLAELLDSGNFKSTPVKAGLENMNPVIFRKNGKEISYRDYRKLEPAKISIRLRSGIGPEGIDKSLRFFLDNPIFEKPEMEKKDGYYQVRAKQHTHYDYLLIPEELTDYSTYLGCTKGAECRLYTYYDEKLSYELQFDESMLNEWRRLNDKSKEFIKSIICKTN